MKTIVLTGGGTAGHIMPNIAMSDNLRNYFDKIYYIGSKNGLEKDIISKIKGVEFIEIETVKFIRKLTLKNLCIPYKLIKSICSCKKILKRIKPDCIFSKGGYVSIPVCIAGKKLGIKVISHESDFSFGLANKIIYHYCDYMCTTFKTTGENKKKCVCTGLPIRVELSYGNKNNLDYINNFNPKLKTILFFGGSLGAKKINQLVFENIVNLCKKYNVIHIVGKGKIEKSFNIKNYIQLEFSNNIGDIFNASDMVVCRSGANAIFELLYLKKPMLLVPLSKEESRGDQIENAEYFFKQGIAKVCQENKLKNNFFNELEKLENGIEKLVNNMDKVKYKSANEQIINLLIN